MMATAQGLDPAAEGQPHSDFRRRWRRATIAAAAACWLYAGGLAALWLLISLASDRWWPATLAMYSPRWLWSVPLALLLPAALLVRRRSLWLPLVISIAVLLGPVMRLCVPWQRALPRTGAASPTMRFVTLNADEEHLDPDAFRKWIKQVRPDVVALQACTSKDRYAIFGASPDGGEWHWRKNGELFVASRFPITASRVYDAPSFSTPHGGTLGAYDVQTPAATVRLFNIHLATPRYGLLAVINEGW